MQSGLNKEKYKLLCKEKRIPLFSQNFWMDAVCGKDNWDVIIVEENGDVIGTMAYFLDEFCGGMEIRKAPLTQNNGVVYHYPDGLKYDKRLSFEYRVANQIIDEIEKLNVVRYRQYHHYNITNWLPFYWRSFKQSTRYTYVIEDTSDLLEVYKGFNGNVRKHIRKAQNIVEIKSGMSAECFYDLNCSTFSRQGIEIPYSKSIFTNLYNNLSDNNCIEIIFAVDKNNHIHSAALFAHDFDSVYYLMSGSNEEFRASQSLTLLIYEGIKIAHQMGKKFDFEGSMKKNIERFFRQFGAEQKPYFDISREF